MSFIEERLLEDLSYGFTGGPTWDTRIISLRNGIDRRNPRRTRPLHRFRGSFDVRDDATVSLLVATFNACQGRAFGFRFRNPMDYAVADQALKVADGGQETVQLTRTYLFGTQLITVPVRKPTSDVVLYADGTEIASTVDTTNGEVTFTATAGESITWTGVFDLPVVFDNDDFMGTIERWQQTTVEVQIKEDLSA